MANQRDNVVQMMRIIDNLMEQGWDEVPLSALEERLDHEKISMPNLKGVLQELSRDGLIIIKHRLRGEMSLWPTATGEGLRERL